MGFIIWCWGTEYIFINSGLTFSVDEKCFKAARCLYRNWFSLRNNARIWETIYMKSHLKQPRMSHYVDSDCYLNQPLCTETSQDLFSFILHWTPWWLIIKTSTKKAQSSHWRAQACAATCDNSFSTRQFYLFFKQIPICTLAGSIPGLPYLVCYIKIRFNSTEAISVTVKETVPYSRSLNPVFLEQRKYVSILFFLTKEECKYAKRGTSKDMLE